MQEKDLVIFQEVHSYEEANDLEALFLKHDIYCRIVEPIASFDAATGASLEQKMTIQINRSDLEKARELLFGLAERNDLEIEDDHYFQEYSDRELLDVLKQEDEWSPEDVTYARKLLQHRKVDFSEEEILQENESAKNTKDLPSKISDLFFAIGLGIALLGGFLGIVFGLFVAVSKKYDRYGNKVFTYDLPSRRKGMFIFVIGIAIVLYIMIDIYFI